MSFGYARALALHPLRLTTSWPGSSLRHQPTSQPLRNDPARAVTRIPSDLRSQLNTDHLADHLARVYEPKLNRTNYATTFSVPSYGQAVLAKQSIASLLYHVLSLSEATDMRKLLLQAKRWM
ncbi:BZ3500_MvSof-1268-A1-R1_Chr9g10912 [Microbotryum saponariae]|uniref:BZ3500_MvSof-1268-A1-R1_Chr9g10912 protein n=1 Tax=Microbotryum saponariae TaxID=289078 RepID=A0A2X0M9B5_9BASI|nr:BZ3501_MvSof-1269-A2-R1_Chr9g10660 [Microbotryum saponariae]SDA00907.1 BZ3500_MvSof-1268-A1-R1_Chr9g10912 [Microbotryum saponariae]